MARKIHTGDALGKRSLMAINSEVVEIPDSTGLVHLQFRRFAGCPMRNLHLRSSSNGTVKF